MIWVPLQLGRGEGEELYIGLCKIYGDVPPKWVDFMQDICKHGSHFDPPQKKPETWVKFVQNQVKNHGESFGKWV